MIRKYFSIIMKIFRLERIEFNSGSELTSLLEDNFEYMDKLQNFLDTLMKEEKYMEKVILGEEGNGLESI